MSNLQLVQFTFTNRLTEPADFSVVLGKMVDGIDGETLQTVGPMTAAKAAADYQISLGDLVEGVNTAAFAQLATAHAALAEAQAALAEAQAANATLAADKAALEAQIEALTEPVVDGVPQVISKMQGRMILAQADLLDDVEAYMAAQPTISPTRIYYQDAADWHRDHPMVLGLAAQLGLTDDQVDAMFVAAKAIV